MDSRTRKSEAENQDMAATIRRLEEELKTTKTLLLAALEQAPAGVVLAQTQPRKVLVASLAALGIIGKPDDSTRDIAVDEHQAGWRLLKPDGREWPLRERPLHQALDLGVTSTGVEAIIEGADGKRRWVEFNAGPVIGENHAPVGGLVVFHDVTDLKELQQDRSRTLSFFAHDMKSPLISMTGLVERLLAGKAGELSGKQREYLNIVGKQAKRVLSLAMDFLDMARLGADGGSLATTRVDTLELLGCIVDEFKNRPELANRKLLAEIPAVLPDLQGDPLRLSRCLGNLMENAVRYGRGPIVLSVLAREKSIAITIGDNGPGIAEEELDKIFDPFTRGSAGAGTEGTGLGLSAVKAIVEAHGGQVNAANRPEGGAAFTVHLPL